MDIVKNIKEVGSELEHGIESGLAKSKQTLANVARHLPFANLAKKDKSTFMVEIDLPGVKKEDIEVNIHDNALNVSAVRKTNKEVKEDDYYMQESFYGKIARTFILPDGIDKDEVDAKLEDGRLFVTLKKVPSAQTKSIAIK
jgi:HSP20 family protein